MSKQELLLNGGKKNLDNDEDDVKESEEEHSDVESNEYDSSDVDEEENESEIETTGESNKIKNDDDEPGDENDTCLYNIGKKLKSSMLDIDELDDELFNEEQVVHNKIIVKPEDRITKPILTKYERVRLLSERRKQLILGAKPMVKVNSLISEKDIATLELNSKVMPLIIVRTLPNGDTEHWKLDELEIIN